MKNLISFIFRLCVGLIALLFIEGATTLGHAFDFESYNLFGWIIQTVLVIIVACIATIDWDSGKSMFDKE